MIDLNKTPKLESIITQVSDKTFESMLDMGISIGIPNEYAVELSYLKDLNGIIIKPVSGDNEVMMFDEELKEFLRAYRYL